MSSDTPTIDWDRYEEFDTIDSNELDKFFDSDGKLEEMKEKFPELLEISKEAIKQNPRGFYIMKKIVEPQLENEVNFIGTDPTEINPYKLDDEESLDIMTEELKDKAWLSMADIASTTRDFMEAQADVMKEWDVEKLAEYLEFTQLELDDDPEIEAEEIQENMESIYAILGMVFGIQGQQRFETTPQEGDTVVVNAPATWTELGDPDVPGNRVDLEEAEEAYGFDEESLWPAAYVSQEVKVVGFEMPDDAETRASIHPEVVVELPHSELEWKIPHHEVVGMAENVESEVPEPEEMNDKLFTRGRLPKEDQEWLVRVPSDYEDYTVDELKAILHEYEQYPSEDMEYTERFRAKVVTNSNRDEEELRTAHKYIGVKLETGEKIPLPPKAFDTRLS